MKQSCLGCSKIHPVTILGKAIKNSVDLAHLVRKGLPAGSVAALAEKLHVSNSALSKKLSIPQRTLTRRLRKASLLTLAESDRTSALHEYVPMPWKLSATRKKPSKGSVPRIARGRREASRSTRDRHGRTDGGRHSRSHRLWRLQLMRFWRICRRRYAVEAMTEDGARLYGGRWKSRGVRVVYTSTSLALAAVETFVNLEPNLRPPDLVSIDGAIPDAVEIGRLGAAFLSRKARGTHSVTCTSIFYASTF